MGNNKKCPIEIALRYIGKKWSLEIIRDFFFGKNRFNEFLESNPKLSSKMLSERLKEFKKNGIIEKKVSNTFPVIIEYELTSKGRALNKILYELAIFAVNACNEYSENVKNNSCSIEILDFLKKKLRIND
ncbi:MAG: winged helix-turn-helix transcriptional regulator [Candidatus Hermodarchaeota archaeon]